jgi:hypothetical protein
MKSCREILFIPLALMGLGLAIPAWSQVPAPSPERRADCQKQAADKGLSSSPERQSFMRECVHGKTAAKPAAPAEPAKAAVPAEPAKAATPAEPAKPAAAKDPVKAPPPASRRDDCRKQASDKGLRGPERRDFMRACMRGK